MVEGLDVLRTINEVICDNTNRPYKDVRITHTVILDDPFENPRGFREPSRSPSPSAERLRNGRIAADEDVDDTNGKDETELAEMRLEREAKARATILEIIGDLPDAEVVSFSEIFLFFSTDGLRRVARLSLISYLFQI